MSILKCSCILTLLCIATGVLAAEPPAPSVGNTLQSEMSQSLQTYVQSENVSQVLVGISIANQPPLTFTNSKAHLNQSEFPIASISKTFTAALILELVQQGKLQLTNTLGQYFPEYPRWRTVSIQMLLNQTSGLPDYSNLPHFFVNMAEHPNHLYPASTLLQMAYRMKPTFAPGAGWAYSNTNYLLLGLIAEKVTGQTLPDLYSHSFFQPLRLHHTLYSAGYYPTDIQNKMMRGFFAQYPATPNNMTWAQGAGGIVSTPSDLVTWAQQIYSGAIPQYFATVQRNRVALQSGQANTDFNTPSYGFGVFSINTPYGILWYTPGLASGYRSVLAYFPCQGVVIAGAINNGNTKMSDSTDLLTRVMQILTHNANTQGAIHHYQATHTLPGYCQLPKAQRLEFPIF